MTTPENVLSPAVLAAHLDDESVLLEMQRKRYFHLNETGQQIWRAIEEGHVRESIVAALVTGYDVDAATAGHEVDRFLEELASAGLIKPGDKA